MTPSTIRQGGWDDELKEQSEPVPFAHPPVESSTDEAWPYEAWPDEPDLDLAILTALLDEWNSAADAAAFDGL